MFENRRWLIVPTSETSSINFGEVLEYSSDTLRLSVDESKTFVKYDVTVITSSYETYHEDAENPGTWYTSSVAAGTYGRPSIYNEGDVEYTHQEMLDLLTGSEWVNTSSVE